MPEIAVGTGKQPSTAKIAGIASTVLWILGFLILFVLPKGSPMMWLSDALLLAGFWPLLFAWRPGWPWMIFGLLDVVIGFILVVAFYLPESVFTEAGKPELIPFRNHIAEYHSGFTWMVIGVISTIYGVVRMIKNLVLWIRARK